MDTIGLNRVEIAGLRIGGLLGHGLHSLGQVVRSRTLWKWVGFSLLTAAFGSVLVVLTTRYVNDRHARALQSPIEKITYLVEDAHGAGRYMVVRHDTTHLKLECVGGQVKNENSEWGTLSVVDCYDFKIGDSIQLEKWDQGEFRSITYVYKMKQAVGEYDYKALKDSD